MSKLTNYLNILLCSAFLLTLAASTVTAQTIDLAGKWQFSLDRSNRGIKDNWFDQLFPDRITLPGALQAQGYGDEISTETPWVLSLYDHYWFLRDDYKAYTKPGNVKVPFLSQPPRHYVGAAWYERDITIPANWQGKRIVLFLERPHWESTVWVDGKIQGSNRSLVAPHEYDLGQLGVGMHRIAIRVDNSLLMAYRPDAHSVSDSLGGSWNGIIGKIELRATSPVWIDDAQVFPNVEKRTATVKLKIGGGQAGNGTVTANGRDHTIIWAADGAAAIEVRFPTNTAPWSEFHPVLQKISLRLTSGKNTDSREVSFGFSEFKAVGNEFVQNGRVVYLRGTHDGGDFPLTGYPPTDVAYWKRIFQISKDWGFNHFRFHSFCPPEAAFQAADELGIYIQPEPGMWNEVSPDTPMERMLYEETDRMIRAYGNHPSFVMLSPSNEPKGHWKEAFDKWIAHYRIADPRRLYNNGTGHTEGEVPGLADGTDFLTMQRIGQAMLRGNSAWFGSDYGKSLEGIHIPVIAHELGQWDAYPDYDVIKKFVGDLQPGNYEIFRDSLTAKGMLARDKDFAYASGRFQLECYKEEIEANLRTPGLDGFQLLDLHDYLGQGTALVGLLDAFWQEKSYVTAAEFRRFNDKTVPLARLRKRVLLADEMFSADLEIANFSDKPIPNAKPYWKIVDEAGNIAAQGAMAERSIGIGKNISLGAIDLKESLLGRQSNGQRPTQFKLVVGLAKTTIENDWNFWVYPSKTGETEPKNVTITHSWEEAEANLAKGSKVLFIPRKADLDWTSPPLDNVPVFWNRLMNPAWGRMLGLWIDKKHPALAEFPTDSYFDWQWSEIVKNARAVNLDRLPKGLQPIVQPIDDWNRNYKLGLIFEAEVGPGKLLVSAADLENSLDKRIVARQLRKSILDYMTSDKFQPKTQVTPENFRGIFFDTRVMKKLRASAGGGPAALALDGDPNTFWLAGNQKDPERMDHELTISFPKAIPFSGLVIMPRQNHREHEGDVRGYLIQISDDGHNWRDIKRGELLSTFEPQRILFDNEVSAKYLKLVSLSGFGADKVTALAELAVIYTGPKLPDDDSDTEYRQSRSASPDIDEGPINDHKDPKPAKTP